MQLTQQGQSDFISVFLGLDLLEEQDGQVALGRDEQVLVLALSNQ